MTFSRQNSTSPCISKIWPAFLVLWILLLILRMLIFFISRVISKAQNKQTTFWKCQDKGYFVITIPKFFSSKIRLTKKMQQRAKIKDDLQVLIATVMFRGTACIPSSDRSRVACFSHAGWTQWSVFRGSLTNILDY